MNTSSLAYSRSAGHHAGAPPSRTAVNSGDPSIVSLSVVEMQRLIDIERSAHVALMAMGTINLPNKHVTEAANALADALSTPALGG